MDAAPHTAESTEAPGGHHEAAGFPPFKTETFPSQFFWLAVTFAFLFVVLWRVAGPRIAGTISARRGKINDDLARAQAARGDADAANGAYLTALAGAKARAQSLAEANRKEIVGEIDRAKSAADAKAQEDIAQAEARIAEMRNAARGEITRAAGEAAAQIVARLTGDTVSASEAADAVRSATGG
jgi:F-type H+-transporting ATPase subunit b